jgi:hypothetical protein
MGFAFNVHAGWSIRMVGRHGRARMIEIQAWGEYLPARHPDRHLTIAPVSR